MTFLTFIDVYGDFYYAPARKIKNIHSPVLCHGRHCVVHNPSDHCMRSFPLHWREHMPMIDIKPSHFERICPHGIGHPDPDDLAYFLVKGKDYMAVHGCDGCCDA